MRRGEGPRKGIMTLSPPSKTAICPRGADLSSLKDNSKSRRSPVVLEVANPNQKTQALSHSLVKASVSRKPRGREGREFSKNRSHAISGSKASVVEERQKPISSLLKKL